MSQVVIIILVICKVRIMSLIAILIIILLKPNDILCVSSVHHYFLNMFMIVGRKKGLQKSNNKY